MKRARPPSAEMLHLIDELTALVDEAWQDDWLSEVGVKFLLEEITERLADPDLPKEAERCIADFRIVGDIISTRQIVISCLGTLSDRPDFAKLLSANEDAS
jgi:hypothetical protein